MSFYWFQNKDPHFYYHSPDLLWPFGLLCQFLSCFLWSTCPSLPVPLTCKHFLSETSGAFFFFNFLSHFLAVSEDLSSQAPSLWRQVFPVSLSFLQHNLLLCSESCMWTALKIVKEERKRQAIHNRTYILNYRPAYLYMCIHVFAVYNTRNEGGGRDYIFLLL